MGADKLVIGAIFANAAVAVPARTAASFDGRDLSFAELETRSNQLARMLSTFDVRAGSRVVLWSGTDLDAVPLFAALAKVGAVFVPINGQLAADEVEAILSRCRPDLVVTGPDAGAAGGTVGAWPQIALDDLGDRAAAHDPDPVDVPGLTGRHPHVAFFTSGSTGRPKGAVLSHEVNYLRTHPGALPEPRGAMVCPYPLFHMGCLLYTSDAADE